MCVSPFFQIFLLITWQQQFFSKSSHSQRASYITLDPLFLRFSDAHIEAIYVSCKSFYQLQNVHDQKKLQKLCKKKNFH